MPRSCILRLGAQGRSTPSGFHVEPPGARRSRGRGVCVTMRGPLESTLPWPNRTRSSGRGSGSCDRRVTPGRGGAATLVLRPAQSDPFRRRDLCLLGPLDRGCSGGSRPRSVGHPVRPSGFPAPCRPVVSAVWRRRPARRSWSSILAGIATIPVARLARPPAPSGPARGRAATSPRSRWPHVAFSRKALTDAPFLLAWLVAHRAWGTVPRTARVSVRAVCRAGRRTRAELQVQRLARRNRRRREPPSPDRSRQTWRRPQAGSATFGWGCRRRWSRPCVYFPWFIFVETHGGYAALLRTIEAIWAASRPGGQLEHSLARPPRCRARETGGGSPARDGGDRLRTAVRSQLSASRAGDWRAFSAGASPRCGSLLVSRPTCPGGSAWRGRWGSSWLRGPAHRLLGAWWLGLSVMTPFYHPYARLWLPLQSVGWMLDRRRAVRLGHSASVDAGEACRPRGSIGVGCGRAGVDLGAVCLLLATIRIHIARPGQCHGAGSSKPADPSRAILRVETVPRRGALQERRCASRPPAGRVLSCHGRPHAVPLEPDCPGSCDPRGPVTWRSSTRRMPRQGAMTRQMSVSSVLESAGRSGVGSTPSRSSTSTRGCVPEHPSRVLDLGRDQILRPFGPSHRDPGNPRHGSRHEP